jgi:hypothetical protein
MIERTIVHRDAYHDPFTLMVASDRARSCDGVIHAAVAMAEPLNLVIVTARHHYDLSAHEDVGPNDLVIVLRAETESAADAAIAAIEQHLSDRAGERQVAEIGPYLFARERPGTGSETGPEPIEWRPPSPPARKSALASRAADADRIARANDLAVQRMQDARPLLAGIGTAGDVLPDMSERTFLHAGPPIEWHDMSGPLRGAIIGAALFEGLASDPEDAVRKAERGAFEFAPGHERGALGPMVGVISRSMPMWVVENVTHGNRAHCNFSEGYGDVLRFGAYGPAVIERLHWLRAVVAPVLASALERLPEPLDLRAISADAVEMGDEVHNRNRAATSLVVRALAPALVDCDEPSSVIAEVLRFIGMNDYFYLNLSMASGKATADAAARIEHSTIVTAMARNGTEFGLRVSGTGDRWFTAPAGEIHGLYRPGYSADDANRDVGDSTITETIGLGGFVMAAAPAICHFAGISAEDALRATLAMYEITWSESVNYRIPALGYRGSPLGIDCRKVVETGIVPVVNTGIAHKHAGVGVIGGGIVRVPIEPFAAAIRALGDASLRAS